MMDKPTLNIVLVEPRIPQNTGQRGAPVPARPAVCIWWAPMGFAIDDKKLKHAGLDYWHYLDITYYDGLEDFFPQTTDPTTTLPPRHPSATPM